MMRHHSRRTFAVVAIVVGIVAGSFASGEMPRLAMGGTRAGALVPLEPLGTFPISIAAGSTIRCVGDSNTSGYGEARGGAAFPGVLKRALDGAAEVQNFGLGGDTAPGGVARVEEPTDSNGLVILMYGTNDADARGMLSYRESVPTEAFKEAMGALIERHRSDGTQVLVLSPLPAGSRAIDRRVAPYRDAAREVASQHRVHFLDPAEAFVRTQDDILLDYDAVHLNPAGHQAIGEWLAGKIEVGEVG